MGKTAFVDGNPITGVRGTIVKAAFLSALNNPKISSQDEDAHFDIGWEDASAYGPVGARTTLEAALAAIGAQEKILFLPAGEWALGAAAITIPVNVHIFWAPGAYFTGTNTVHIRGSFANIPLHYIFQLTGAGLAILWDESLPYITLSEWYDPLLTKAVDIGNAYGGLRVNVNVSGHLSLAVAGSGLKIKAGTNARIGVAPLVAGTVTVNNTSITANTRIFLTVQSLGTIVAPVPVAVSSKVAGTSFTIVSADNTDTSVIAWLLVEST